MIRSKWLIPEEYKDLSIELLQENLPSLRARVGISQEELANVIGVSRQTYYSIEAGKRDMLWCTYLTLMFFFNSIDRTAEMIRDLRVYPIDLVMRFNDELTPEQMDKMLAEIRR